MDSVNVNLLEVALEVAPITTLIIVCVGISVWATRKLLNEHISSLKEFIEYLKRGSKDD